MLKSIYGYARVSSVEQNPARQTSELTQYGIEGKNIYVDKVSGKNFDRPQYQRLKKKLTQGDVLVIKSIDRLGRNYAEIQNEWSHIVKKVGADIVVLDMDILDTRANKDLMGTLISDIVLQLLSYVAQVERENIKQRQAEGIACARRAGKHLGRVARPYPKDFLKYREQWQAGCINKAQAALLLGISKNQFQWYLQRFLNEEKNKSSQGVENVPRTE